MQDSPVEVESLQLSWAVTNVDLDTGAPTVGPPTTSTPNFNREVPDFNREVRVAADLAALDDFKPIIAQQFKAFQANVVIQHEKVVNRLRNEILKLRRVVDKQTKRLRSQESLADGSEAHPHEDWMVSRSEQTDANDSRMIPYATEDSMSDEWYQNSLDTYGSEYESIGECDSNRYGMEPSESAEGFRKARDKRVSAAEQMKEALRARCISWKGKDTAPPPDIIGQSSGFTDVKLPEEPIPNEPAPRTSRRSGRRSSKQRQGFRSKTRSHFAALHDRTKALYAGGSGERRGVKSVGGRPSIHPFPKETWTPVQRFVFSNSFELMSGVVIMGNTIIMAFQMQYDGIDSGHHLSYPTYLESAHKTWPGAKLTFFISAILFNALFFIELCLRVAANRWRSIRSGWIWFDAVIVAVGVTDIVAQGDFAINPSMMRVLRLVRLVRLLKVFQAMSSFDSLFLLLKAIYASRQALVWSFLILGLVQLVVGLFLCQFLQEFINDDNEEIEPRRITFKYFGTFSNSMLTMFEITLANWIVPCRALVDNVSDWFIAFFIIYRCMFGFAILRVIAAVFITETNRVLEQDDELTIMKRNREKNLFKNKLETTFRTIDPEGVGTFGWKHLQKAMHDQSLAALVTTLGFDLHDFEKLFWLLDDGTGEISIKEFVGKMGKLKGQSKTIDTLTMLKLAHRIDQKIQTIFEKQGLLERNEMEAAEEDLACKL